MDEIFEFDYVLEMYKPAEQRIWGYYALPILYGDRLVGKLDATADHREGELRVAAIHQDVPFTKAMAAAVDREVRDLATVARVSTLPLALAGGCGRPALSRRPPPARAGSGSRGGGSGTRARRAACGAATR